ncbi:uncharacterized protein LOC133314160 [Gastrolobium bilobum]|uniref:uncharacterized protein LOC133314160 n=1 Tax=Gastrolobium bilobum TaxID=150636 RepID=UPI002AB26C92|nr:uncharacterized protein LOC133314160 [Gastrolobium bilobum]
MATITNGNTMEENGARAKSKPKRICFSFAAYANNLLHRLKSSNVVVDEGLSDTEFSYLESKFNFSFPPDLRVILQQGLPISPGFPNWRSSSTQQLQILLNLPSSSILRRVSDHRFWHPSWGPQPPEPTHAARRLLNDAPILVPIYRHCYMPSSRDVAGNPVFYVDHRGDVRLLSFDIAGFFREAEFMSESEDLEPVWAATTARRIEFWSEMADASGGRWWWWGRVKGELGVCLEGVVCRLRDGGWREEEIREMMTVTEEDEEEEETKKDKHELKLKDKEAMVWHVRVLSLILLRAGWSREDVVDSLGVVGDEGKSWLEFHQEQSTLNIKDL